MKKLFLFLAAIATLVACEGPIGPAGPMGPKGPAGPAGKPGEPGYGASWYTGVYTISKSDWYLMGGPGDLNSYFYADVDIPQLTDDIYYDGTVIGYIETQKGVKNGLPFVLHMGEEQDNYEFLWTQTYDFDFSPGMVRFYISYSDFNTQIPPGSETFYIVLMW